MVRASVATLALVALLASTATALRPTSCLTRLTSDNQFLLGALCYRLTSTEDIVGTLNVRNGLFAGNQIKVFAWDITNAGGFSSGDVSVVSGSVTASSSAVSFGSGAGAEYIIDLENAAFTNAETAAITITVSNSAARPVGLTITLEPLVAADPPQFTTTRAANLNIRADATTFDVVLMDSFLQQRVVVKEVVITLRGDANGLPASTVGTGLPATPATPTQVDNAAGTVRTFTFTDVQRPADMNGGMFTFTFNYANAASYDFVNLGPFLIGSISASVTYFPKVASGQSFTATETGLWEVTLPSMWNDVTYRTNFDTAASPPTSVAVTVVENPENPAAPSGAVTTTVPPAITDPTLPLQNYTLLAPVQLATPSHIFLSVVVTGTGSVSVTPEVVGVTGECSSYVDCRDIGDNNPSTRAGSSDNSADRFVHCALLPSVEDPTVATASCIECLNDCDCGAGQYCHTDPGVCNSDGMTGFYTCDTTSRRALGLCRDKDPAGEIIGKACRTVSLVTPGSSSQPALKQPVTLADGLVAADLAATVATPENLPLFDGPVEADIPSDIGVGFCGRAAYFPETNNDVGGDVSRARGARAILWQGYCYNGMCNECLGDANTCGGAQECIDGSLADTIIVDGTSRTFSNNTVAGTMLAAVFMLIIVQCCLCCRIIQESRYRKQDRNEAGKDLKAAAHFN